MIKNCTQSSQIKKGSKACLLRIKYRRSFSSPLLFPLRGKQRQEEAAKHTIDDIGIADFSPVRQIFQCNLRAAPSRGPRTEEWMNRGGEEG